jgi:hypothetical protein
VRVVADLLDEHLSADRFLQETALSGYDNGPSNLTVQDDQADVFETIAVELADAAMTKHKDRVFSGCDPSQAGGCKQAFFDGFVVRAFRRPPTPGEADRMGRLFDSAGVEATILAVLQSPAFLYREELGEDPPPGGSAPLSPYELASELSFLITGSMPDVALFAVARDGHLATSDDLRREATRLLKTPAAKEQLRLFFDEWLATTTLANTSKDPAFYPSLDPPLSAAMRRELDWLYARAADGTIAVLFGSSASLADARLARHYGIPADMSEFTEVDLDPAVRAGALSRAGFLTVHSGYDNSNPIERGVFVRHAILCEPPRPAPPGVPRNVPTDHAKTTRDRYAAHTANPFCMSCHTSIDGIGFGFEQFDAIGALRTEENGNPVDTSGLLYDSDGADGAFSGVTQLEEHMLASPRLVDCFGRQLYRFAMGIAETDADDATIRSIANGKSVDSQIADWVLAVVGSRAFRERGVEEP